MIEGYLNSVDKFIVVGDRVLIKVRDMDARTRSGLVLPASVREKEEIQSGYVIKPGPGYAIPSTDSDEPWKKNDDQNYIPLQAKEGDLAIFIKSKSFEIEFEEEKYLIVPHSAILLLIRDDEV